MDNILVKGKHFNLEIPRRVHIPAEDGGHLIIKPHRQVTDSTDLPFNEAVELPVMKDLGRKVLLAALDAEIARGGIGTFNYQENGNWSVHKPLSEQHAHIHIYGRARDAKTQPFGHALDFSQFELGHTASYPYSATVKQRLRDAAAAVLSGDLRFVYMIEPNRDHLDLPATRVNQRLIHTPPAP